jgi:hypothetical protein
MNEFKPTAPHVYTAIAEVTAKLAKTGISKDRNNAQQGYKFRGIDDVYNALSGVIAEAKLCLLPRVLERTVTERVTQKGGVLFYVVCDVDFDIVSAVDGSKHTVHVIGEAMDSADKATNKAMSAAYKYMAMQVFCIPTEGDNDADATTHEAIQPKAEDAAITQYAVAMRKAVAAVDAEKTYAVHLDLHAEGEEMYRAVWSKLDSKTRAAAKDFIDLKKNEAKAA